MNELSNKISYIKGLADGLSLSTKSDEGKVLNELIELVLELTNRVEELEEEAAYLEEVTEELDDSLLELYEDLEEEYDDEDEYYSDDDFFNDDDDAELFEMECPECHEDIMIDYDMIDSDNCIVCSNCGKEIELNIDFDDEDEE